MPRQHKKLKLYSLEDLQNAIAAVKRGSSVNAASKNFNVPRTTIKYKLEGKYELDCRMGPETTLTKDEEETLVKWICSVADAGFTVTRLQLLDSVQMLLKKLNRLNKFTKNRPGRKWYKCFLRRHPIISERLTQNLTKARSEVTEQKIRNWFNEVTDHFKAKNIEDVLKDPSRIFNLDETAFFMAPKGIKCLMRKGEKLAYNFISNDDKECLTTLITVCANGSILPPMIMFSYERIPASVSSLMSTGW
ncbi:uncharacterized protein [Onthophagus taurus]|uniref:uncharacterized protein n=1 Tax=Onthophagus taurus TaxID=166361 RepID=UPI0039BE7D00